MSRHGHATRTTQTRWAHRACALAVSLVLALAPGGWAAPARALDEPVSPSDPTKREAWVNPQLRAGDSDDDLRVDLVDTAAAAALAPDAPLQLRLRLHNQGTRAIKDLTVQPVRGGAVADLAESRDALTRDIGTFFIAGHAQQLDQPLGPGESLDLTLDIPTAAGVTNSLELAAGQTYPVAVKAIGQRAAGAAGSGSGSGSGGTGADADGAAGAGAADGPGAGQSAGVTELLTTERMLVSVASPAAAAAPGGPSGPGAPPAPRAPEPADDAAAAPGLSLLYPLSAPTPVVPGETGDAPEDAPLVLRNDDLAGELAPNGRLSHLLDSYDSAVSDPTTGASLAAASCLALDPALIDAVRRMAGGYTVASHREPTGKPARRLRDSWRTYLDGPDAQAGSGAQAAAAWLDRLRAVAQGRCVVALPWANADVTAVARTGNSWLAREAIERGPAVIADALGTRPLTNVVIPGSGYLTEQAVPAMGWADASLSPAFDGGLATAWEQTTAANTPQPAAPPPAEGVSVLVAANSVWGAPAVDRFSQLAPGIRAVTYHDSLAAVLAATGPNPATPAFANPDYRVDQAVDSEQARAVTAAAALRLALGEAADATSPQAGGGAQPVLVAPPAVLDAAAADAVLAQARASLAAHDAAPLGLHDYVTATPAQEEALAQLVQSSGVHGPADAPRLGAPYIDPAEFTNTEVAQARQLADSADALTRIMVNDHAIALSRYGFTAPLRQDALRALSITGRRAMALFDSTATATANRLTADLAALSSLRASVALIPPGNVYTRTSAASPLLIVAENGLPLPVDATISYYSADEVEVHTPGRLRIPARGSITVQMTTDTPAQQESTTIGLWLSLPDATPIGDRVDIAVRTRAGILGRSALVLGVGAVVMFGLLFRFGAQRRKHPRPAQGGRHARREDEGSR